MSDIKYGVKLVSYKGQDIGLWTWTSDGRFEGTQEEAAEYKKKCDTANPGGVYVVYELPEKSE